MPDGIAQWLMFAFFVGGSIGGWLTLILFWIMTRASYKRVRAERKTLSPDV